MIVREIWRIRKEKYANIQDNLHGIQHIIRDQFTILGLAYAEVLDHLRATDEFGIGSRSITHAGLRHRCHQDTDGRRRTHTASVTEFANAVTMPGSGSERRRAAHGRRRPMGMTWGNLQSVACFSSINVKRHKKCRGALTINVAFEPL